MSGFHPKPHFIFCLDPKNEAKKVKTVPASLEKLTVGKLKSPNSSLRSSDSGYFLRFPSLFFGSPDKVTRQQTPEKYGKYSDEPGFEGIKFYWILVLNFLALKKQTTNCANKC